MIRHVIGFCSGVLIFLCVISGLLEGRRAGVYPGARTDFTSLLWKLRREKCQTKCILQSCVVTCAAGPPSRCDASSVKCLEITGQPLIYSHLKSTRNLRKRYRKYHVKQCFVLQCFSSNLFLCDLVFLDFVMHWSY